MHMRIRIKQKIFQISLGALGHTLSSNLIVFHTFQKISGFKLNKSTPGENNKVIDKILFSTEIILLNHATFPFFFAQKSLCNYYAYIRNKSSIQVRLSVH